MTAIIRATDVAAHLAYLAPFQPAAALLASIVRVECWDDQMNFIDARGASVATYYASGAVCF
jgi:hypothetical protein